MIDQSFSRIIRKIPGITQIDYEKSVYGDEKQMSIFLTINNEIYLVTTTENNNHFSKKLDNGFYKPMDGNFKKITLSKLLKAIQHQ